MCFISTTSREKMNDILKQTIEPYTTAMSSGGRLKRPQDSLKSPEIAVLKNVGDGGGKPAAAIKK